MEIFHLDTPTSDGSDTDSENKSETKFSIVTQNKLITISILLTAFFQDVTHYSITCNLILYCEKELLFSTEESEIISMIFFGVAYCFPFFVGYLADTLFGRFSTICGCGLILVLGMLSISISTEPNWPISARIKFFLCGLFLVTIATYTFRSNLMPFGAQQFENQDQTQKVINSFYSWFYWIQNLAVTFTYFFIAYIQKEISFFYGYLLSTLCMLFSIFIFALPKGMYKYEDLCVDQFKVKHYFEVIISAFRNYKKKRQILKLPHFLDYANFTNGGSMSEQHIFDSRRINQIIPILATVILFRTVFCQMDNLFLLQGKHLNLNLTRSSEYNIVVPVPSLVLFNSFSILLLIPLVDKVIFPFSQHYFNFTLNHLHKMALGLIFAAAAMFTAGILEIIRKNDIEKGNGWIQTVGVHKYMASKISVFAQIPQFLLIGIGEVLTCVTLFEFAFEQAPIGMRSMVTGSCFLTSGFGAFISTALVAVVSAVNNGYWMTNDLNKGKMENFCFLLSCLLLADFILFIFVVHILFPNHKEYFQKIERIKSNEENLSLYKEQEQFVLIPPVQEDHFD